MPSADSYERSGVAVAPRGGPQPAKRSKADGKLSFLEQAGRTFSGLHLRNALGQTHPDAGPSVIESLFMKGVDAATPAPPYPLALGDQSWKPTPETAAAFLSTLMNEQSVNPGHGFGVPAGGAGVGDRSLLPPGGISTKTNSAWSALLANPQRLYDLLATAKDPRDLAAKLDLPDEDAATLLGLAAQEQETKAKADSAISAQEQVQRDQINSMTAPARGGSTPDSIDRMPSGDPLAYAEAAPLNSSELNQLLLGLHAQDANEGPAKLEAMKRQLLADAQTESQRIAQLNDIYRAGLEGRPMPPVAGPQESTAQSQYAVASPVSPTAMPFTPEFGTADAAGRMTDEAILQAAGLVEEKRRSEAQWQLANEIEQQARAVGAAEQEAASAKAKADKDAAAAVSKAEQDAYEAQVRKAYAEDVAAEAIDKAESAQVTTKTIDGDTLSGAALYRFIRRRLAAGARTDDVIAAAFPDAVEGGLSPAQLQLIQAARVSLGSVPDEMKTDWQAYLNAAMMARAGG